MSELPPLPELPNELEAYFGPAGAYKPGSDDDHVAFISVSEMQEYALRAQADAWNAAIEWAAKVVEVMPEKTWHDGSDQFGNPCPWSRATTPRDCAAAIRQGRK